MKQALSIFCLSVFIVISLFAKPGSIKGHVVDLLQNKPIPAVTVIVKGSGKGTISNSDGSYVIDSLPAGLYNLQFSHLGYKVKMMFEVDVAENRSTRVDVILDPSSVELKEIVVNPNLFSKSDETPVSSRSLGSAEILRAPGGARDISRVVEVLPGVASSPANNRNDLIIRGGNPSENKFYLDGFEITSINHFTTQGATGGVWGIIDANAIREMNLITSAFPATSANALSSVFDLQIKEGSREQANAQCYLGVIQSGLYLHGPLSGKMTYLLSLRTANFNWLIPRKNPIIPTFYDGLLKTCYDYNFKNRVEVLFLGSQDEMSLNKAAEKTDENLYTLERAREIDQWIYTAGIKYTHYWDDGFTACYISRNSFSNRINKHQDNDESKLRLLDYTSEESENKIKFENKFFFKHGSIGFGANFDAGKYRVDAKYFRVIQQVSGFNAYETGLTMKKYGLSGNAAWDVMPEVLKINFGFRVDGSDYSGTFSNPLHQFSPRLSITYLLTGNLHLTASWGMYYQHPSYTMLGYREAGVLVNKNNLKPIAAQHFVTGIEYLTDFNSAVSLEGFYKQYDDYPFSVIDQVSLANKGAGFGVFGAEEVISASKGRSYGLEALYQQKLSGGYYGILALTFVTSEFKAADNTYVPSSWDYGTICNASIGKQFADNWEAGLKVLYSAGSPYTPYDEAASSVIANWDKRGSGILDYKELNTRRTDDYFEIDLRVDKKYFFEKWSLGLYVDIRNLFDYKHGGVPDLILQRDDAKNAIVNPDQPDSYKTKTSEPGSIGRQLNLGILLEF